MPVVTEKLLEKILVLPGLVSEEDFLRAKDIATTSKRTIEDVLVEKGYISDVNLGKLVGEALGFPCVDVERQKVDHDVFFILPEDIARSQGVVALATYKDGVRVGMRDPKNIELINVLEKKFGNNILVHYITQKGFERLLRRYAVSIEKEIERTIEQLTKATSGKKKKDTMIDEYIISLTSQIITLAFHRRVSDIHIEPTETGKAMVRFRIDGLLHDMFTFDGWMYEYVLSRIKVLSRLRTDEHRTAQDGKFVFTVEDTDIDLRVSIVPTNNGENLVMRLLVSENKSFDLLDLGFSKKVLPLVDRAIREPHGMVLVTGPTGSGKTTSLYAMLKMVNSRDVHIATIEDPVEYNMDGVTQIQVDSRSGLTFAKGLRSIVRQDPDIIMVGEIRDEETAGIAVNSALTGHLVFSTLHTNDTATTLPRLLDMDIEPFLISSTVHIIIAQRLVRKICSNCVQSYVVTKEDIDLITMHPIVTKLLKKHGEKQLKKLRLYKGSGCSVCANTGYSGRIGIFEVLPMTSQIRHLVMNHANAEDIESQALEDGMISMLEDGVQKAVTGITTLSEVLRVAGAL